MSIDEVEAVPNPVLRARLRRYRLRQPTPRMPWPDPGALRYISTGRLCRLAGCGNLTLTRRIIAGDVVPDGWLEIGRGSMRAMFSPENPGVQRFIREQRAREKRAA